jgi:hypothetical protein
VTVDVRPVLSSPGHPAGFCPIHVFSIDGRCNQWCLDDRIALAVLQEDYRVYWRSQGYDWPVAA